MLQARFVKQGTAVLFSCLLLTSCSDSQSPLLSFLEESNFNRPVVNLSDIYGSEWTAFAFICADTPSMYSSEVLDLPIELVPDLEGSEQSGIVFWSDDSVESDLLNPSDVVLCDSTTSLVNKLTVPTLSFSKGVNGEWLASNLSVSQDSK